MILSDSYCPLGGAAVDRCKKRDRISGEFGEPAARSGPKDGEEEEKEEDGGGEGKANNACVLIVVGVGADNSRFQGTDDARAAGASLPSLIKKFGERQNPAHGL